VYDGFLVQSREGSAAALSQAPLATITAPNPTLIRDDSKVPVLVLTTETDLVVLGYRTARQPDTKVFRDWEIAGTSHADSYSLSGGNDTGDGAGDITLFDAMATPPASPALGCAPAINAGDETYVVRAALHALHAWVVDGTPPPHSPQLQLNDTDLGYALDAHGNALGGIRTPAVDAPVAQLSGIPLSTNSALCRLFGVTKPFDASTLASLYPTHAAFVHAWDRATAAAVKAGFVLHADAAHLEAAAAQSSVGTD
jgi:Alpha/beta hydrolase domain